MHFKKIIVIILFMMLCARVWSQNSWASTPDTPYIRIYQVNATALIKQFLPLNNYSAFSYNPFLISYKKKQKSGKFSRINIGYAAFSDFDGVDDNTSSKDVEFSYGTEKHFLFTRKLVFYPGIDFQVAYSRSFGDNPSLGTRVGLAPLAGLEYRITPRIRINTEASLNIFLASPGFRRIYRTGSEFQLSVPRIFGVEFLSPDFINIGIAF
jgi:hypothetical protein